MIQAAPKLMPVLLEMSRDSDLNLSRWSMEFAGSLAFALDLEAQHISGFVPRLQEALKSNDEATVFNAAIVLSRYAPDTEGLANALVRYASDPWRQSAGLGGHRPFGHRCRIDCSPTGGSPEKGSHSERNRGIFRRRNGGNGWRYAQV